MENQMKINKRQAPERKMKAREENAFDLISRLLNKPAKKSLAKAPEQQAKAPSGREQGRQALRQLKAPAKDQEPPEDQEMFREELQRSAQEMVRRRDRLMLKMPLKKNEPLPPPEEIVEISFDEEGNFIPPPIDDYWLRVLEEQNAKDPDKQGPDWRDEAIAAFRKARKELDDLERDFYRQQGK